MVTNWKEIESKPGVVDQNRGTPLPDIWGEFKASLGCIVRLSQKKKKELETVYKEGGRKKEKREEAAGTSGSCL
jgi:hypothetical protein